MSFLNFRQGAAPAPGRGIAKTDYSDLDNSSLRARTFQLHLNANPTPKQERPPGNRGLFSRRGPLFLSM